MKLKILKTKKQKTTHTQVDAMFCLQITRLRVLRFHKEKFVKVTIIAKKKKSSNQATMGTNTTAKNKKQNKKKKKREKENKNERDKHKYA